MHFVFVFIFIDIAEIREGCVAYAFDCYPDIRKDSTLSSRTLTIIGTEGSYSLEMNSSDTRDWFLIRMRLMIHDMLSIQEITAKKYRLMELGDYRMNAHALTTHVNIITANTNNTTTSGSTRSINRKNTNNNNSEEAIENECKQMKILLMRKIQVML